MRGGFRHPIILFMLAVISGIVPACGAVSPSPAASGSSPTLAAQPSQVPGFALTSDAFQNGGLIPKRYTCDGENISPALAWQGASSAKSYTLILDDPDAPSGTFTHWVVFDIPGATRESPEGVKNLGKDAVNSQGRTGYTGPCPPSGTHRYIFTLYALDSLSLGIRASSTRADVEAAMKDHIVGTAVLLGKYSR